MAFVSPSFSRMNQFSPETTFLDFEDITNLFHKRYKQAVNIYTSADSPITILKAEVSDRGTRRFPDLKGGVDDYQVKVRNVSGKLIRSYEVTWTLRHPFEDYTIKKISTNSIEKLGINRTQKLEFRRDKYFRDDAYYYVEITKVQFDDESVWEAPEREEVYSELDAIKKEIESIDEKNIDDMTTDEIIEQTGATTINGAPATKN